MTGGADSAGFALVTLKSGVKSLRCLEHQETFHPGIGPLAEARILHVDQARLRERADHLGKICIWDVGFGAAANAIAAILALQDSSAVVELHSFDKSISALEFALSHAEELEYLLPFRDLLSVLIRDGKVTVRPGLTWVFHAGDFRETMQDQSIPSPHSIIYDPYSPSGNQEMWTLDHFTQLYARLDPAVPFLLTNYTRSTAVRTTLLLAGFFVGTGTVIGEKAETTIASNRWTELTRPLGEAWLKRARVSRNGAPMRGPNYRIEPIADADFARLVALKQFETLK